MIRSLSMLGFSLILLASCQRREQDGSRLKDADKRDGRQDLKEDVDLEPLPDLDSVLSALQSDDEQVRERATNDLSRMSSKDAKPVATAQGLKILRTAAQPYPFKKPAADVVTERLFWIVSRDPRPEYVPIVVELFEKLSDKGKSGALVILARLESREAALAYMNIVRQHAKAGRVPELVTGPLEAKPRHAEVFFPELLKYATIPGLSANVYRLCLAYAQARLVSADTIAPYVDQVLSAYRGLAEKLRPAQRDKGITWMWDERYSEWREDAGLLLDLLGYLPAKSVEPELRRALDYRDTRLQFFAIISLLRLGKAVDPAPVAAVAAQAEMRNSLYKELQAQGKQSLFPEKYRTQSAFAESDMVNWLTFPTELGRVPDEIELMKVVPVDTGLKDGIYDYYLFRFRTHEPHWAAKDGWMAGVSGPYLRKDSPTVSSLGDTFSSFEKWDSKKPDDHVGDTRELMERWRQHHSEHK